MSLETRPVNTIGVTRALHITHHHTNHHCILSHLSQPRLFSVTGICDWRDHHHVTTGQATHVVSPGSQGTCHSHNDDASDGIRSAELLHSL